jgi:hypothetical protein
LATNDSTRGCAITRWRANERTSPRGACRAIRSQRSRSLGRRSIVAIRATASVAAKRKRGFEQERAWTGWSCNPCYAQGWQGVQVARYLLS